MASAAAPVLAAEEYTGASFDLAAYLQRSRQLDISDIDLSRVRDWPIDGGEIRCLKYMMDIESHTLCYLNDVLNAGAGHDPEIADFLGCWLYEESYHGRALERFARAAGHDLSADICGRRRLTLSARLEKLATAAASKLLGKDFLAVYMTWGAIQEHSTLFGYTNLARRTRNEPLAEILRRIAREESRHFGFYYYKAHQFLKASPAARRVTAFLLRRFWKAVGEGVKPSSETDFLLTYIFEGKEGQEAIARIDRTMRRLPGMEWFDLMTRRYAAAVRRAP